MAEPPESCNNDAQLPTDQRVLLEYAAESDPYQEPVLVTTTSQRMERWRVALESAFIVS